jgi:2-keto-4-pentenoate hydratase/2-oxohepta-3-ene-1,7-dioic acid hydratase in catechol pathway
MRLISYRAGQEVRIGARHGDDIVDLGAARSALIAERGGLPLPADMVALLEGGPEALDAAAETVAFAEGRPELHVKGDPTLAPVVPQPRKFICVARNYAAHAAEANLDVLQVPNLFIRFADSLVGDGEPVQVPIVSEQVDWEAELAVVIGRTGRHVPAERAYDYVAGYAIFNDVSIRDWQIRKPPVQFGAGKNFDGSGPLGPDLVTKDEVGDPMNLELELQVNGEVMQSSNTKDMIFSIPVLIEHISQFTTLRPGDVIATGTPSGVGHFRQPPRYLAAGDVVSVEIEGLGVQSNPVVAESSVPAAEVLA